MKISKYPVTKEGIRIMGWSYKMNNKEYLVKVEIENKEIWVCIKKKIMFGFTKTVYRKFYLDEDMTDYINENDFLIKLASITIQEYLDKYKVTGDIKWSCEIDTTYSAIL